MLYRNIGIVFTFALATIAGCTQESATEADPLGEGRVATVNGAPIQDGLFGVYAVGRLQKEADFLTDDEHDALLEELIEFRLLARAAEQEGLIEEGELAAQLEIQRLQALARAMATNFLDENPATEAELQLAYQQNVDALSGPQYKARHILVDAEEEALAIIGELDQGADFQELAQTRSTGPSGPSGGDLGWFSPDTMVAPFADAVREMELGSYTAEPVATRFGWHVILLEDYAQQEPPGLEAVRDEIQSFVEQRKIAEYLQELREVADVTIGEEVPEEG
ncbi:MAG: peptidylprolyl isomerase [Gammaproteobacteria bacterium]